MNADETNKKGENGRATSSRRSGRHEASGRSHSGRQGVSNREDGRSTSPRRRHASEKES